MSINFWDLLHQRQDELTAARIAAAENAAQ